MPKTVPKLLFSPTDSKLSLRRVHWVLAGILALLAALMLKARLPIQNAAALRRFSSISGSAARLLTSPALRATSHASPASSPLRGYFRPLVTAVQSVLNGNPNQLPASMTIPTEAFDATNFELLQRVKLDYAEIEVSAKDAIAHSGLLSVTRLGYKMEE